MRLAHKIIRHRLFRDVCFKVHHALDLPHKIKLRGEWINQGFTSSFYINQKQTIQISRAALGEWQWCRTPDAKCLRYADWEALK